MFRNLCLIIFIALAGLTGCSAPDSSDTLSISGPFEPISLDPARSGYIFSRMQVIETLVDIDNKGQLKPGLATRWEHSKDNRVWTFYLRPNVVFHDQSAMNADAVVNSLNIAFSKPAPYPQDLVEAVTALNESTVQITLSRPYRPFASLLTNYTTAILSPASYNESQEITKLSGTGPYQVEEFQPPHRVGVTKFQNYWGEPAHVSKVVYTTGHRAETRALMVASGQTDIVYNLDAASVDLLKVSKKAKVDSTLIPRTILIKVNASYPALADVKVRQALSLAIDRQGIATKILRVEDIEANQLFGPSMGVWHDATLPPAEQDVKRANALLDEAGWLQDDSGIRHKNGSPLKLNMITYANRAELIVIATALQNQWAQIGVDLRVHMENASAIPSGHADGTLQLALMARNFANIPDPLGIMLADFTSTEGGDWGPMGWQNPSVFSALSALPLVQDKKAYASQVQNIMHQINADLPVIPVVFYMQQSAVAPRVENFSFDPYERSFRLSDITLKPAS
ncbi:ABC transporter substrate-binding protein [Alteromonas pelagimontana]|uniref:ABC transporter substrate-binding protein n=1 Tax=Alteromonas pelagimontana TaxID=1858656 RepID=A0A6M4MD94_9ALTE|nr:ABC transporter substrate-binding protein [Alteromonas pelagimontana]QJR81092.1 ABC transporter substrate-binding protein [Alteromonas pelagimontana]